jgi:hypothetical protein
MKRTQLLVLSVLAFGFQGVAQASPYPADGEASYNLVAADSYAAQQERSGTWGVNERSAQASFPADGEASFTVEARGSYMERHAIRPDSAREMRSQSAFPYSFPSLDG